MVTVKYNCSLLCFKTTYGHIWSDMNNTYSIFGLSISLNSPIKIFSSWFSGTTNISINKFKVVYFLNSRFLPLHAPSRPSPAF